MEERIIAGQIKKGFNNYKIFDDNTCEFYIESKKYGNFTVYVDIEDLERLIKFDKRWYITKRKFATYVRINIHDDDIIEDDLKGVIYLHRWILRVNDKNLVVDHINHNPYDNRKSNLRITTELYNLKNRKGKNVTNKSGYRNVSWNNNMQKWAVTIKSDGVQYRFGFFEDVKVAAHHAEAMRKKLFGEFAGGS